MSADTFFGECSVCDVRSKLPAKQSGLKYCKKCGGIIMPSEAALAAGHENPVVQVRRCTRCTCVLRSSNKGEVCDPCSRAIFNGLTLEEKYAVQEALRKPASAPKEDTEPDTATAGYAAYYKLNAPAVVDSFVPYN